MEQEKQQFLKLIKESTKILLVSHESPDRDAIGSLVSMYWILQELTNAEIIPLNETKSSVTEGFLEGQDKIVYDKIENNMSGVDLIIVLDTNSWSRITKSDFSITNGIKKVVLDHHTTELDIETDLYLKLPLSSNCEVIFTLLNDVVKITPQIAKPLLMGIYDDTGGFKYKGTNENTFKTVIELIKTGVEISEIARESSSLSVRHMRMGKDIWNKAVFDVEKRFFYGYLDRKAIEEYGLSYTDVDLVKDVFISMMLEVKEIDWGFLIKPKANGVCTVSFRSKPNSNIHAADLAKKFGGGGHKSAAGATLDILDAKEAMEYVLKNI